VLKAADVLGKRVPGDLAVIGYGDDPNYCYSTYPSLSSIAHPAHGIGELAAELLQRQMAGHPVEPGSRTVPVDKLVPRESSDTVAIADPEIRSLVRHIRLRAPHEALRVSELAELSSLSMTTIKERFATSLGHGPKQEIQRVRLRHLRHLLADPGLSLADIARSMQFGSAHELSRFFFAETGQRPSDFRERPAPARVDRRVAAVIFDMDGTLFDTEPVYYAAYRQAYALQGGELGEEEYVRDLLGLANQEIERRLAAKAPGSFMLDRFRKEWREHWRNLIERNPPVPLPGVRETIEMLLERGVPLALASSSDRAEIELCLHSAGLAPYFTVRASGDEVAEGKPAPDIYRLACGRLGVESGDCVAVEDSPHGVAAALAAGMHVVQISASRHVPPSGVTLRATLEDLGADDWSRLLSLGKVASADGT
jgi:LacI family transcriptional regulator